MIQAKIPRTQDRCSLLVGVVLGQNVVGQLLVEEVRVDDAEVGRAAIIVIVVVVATTAAAAVEGARVATGSSAAAGVSSCICSSATSPARRSIG